MRTVIQDNILEQAFIEKVDLFLKEYPDLISKRNVDANDSTVIFLTIGENGFEVKAYAQEQRIIIYAGELVHYLIPVTKDVDETASLALGLIYDLLSPYTRLIEISVGGKIYCGEIQVNKNGVWCRTKFRCLLKWTLFRKKDEVIKQNQQLPSRI